MKSTIKNKLMLTMLLASLLMLSLSGLGKAQTTAGQDDDNVGPSAVTMGSIIPVETFTGQISCLSMESDFTQNPLVPYRLKNQPEPL